MNTYGLRQASVYEDIEVIFGDFTVSFSNWLLPIILTNGNNEILKFLVSHDGFNLSTRDLNSFIMVAINKKW